MKTIQEKFFKRYHGNDKFPKRISDPILCDDMVDFILSEITALMKEELSAWERVKLEIDSVVCNCGEPWHDSDFSLLIEKNIKRLKAKHGIKI